MRLLHFNPDRRGFMQRAGTAASMLLACACGRAAAQPPGERTPVAGAAKSVESKVLGAGADMLQSRGPINAISMYLDGFHFYADDMGRQIEAHHYCTHLNEEFFQCVIYDGNTPDARLIGIEYIVSERIFSSLPQDEKRLWHSHRHETTSGELVMPGIPETVEHTAIGTLVSTYGKTWHTWQIDRNLTLPLGIPQLMMGFTGDNQLQAEMIDRRNQGLGISAQKLRQAREDLVQSAAPVQPGADSWQSGRSPQLMLTELNFKNNRG